MPRTSAAKVRYADRIARGLCGACGEKSDGGTKCPTCRDNDKLARDARLAARKVFGQCVSCPGTAKAGCTLCESCIAKRSAVSSEHYRRRKEAGTCFYCSELPVEGMSMCEYHLQRQRDARRKLKTDALEAYGGLVCSTAGCGCNDPDILEIDHIAGAGDNIERRKKLRVGWRSISG